MVGHTEVIVQNGALSYRRLPSSCGHALATIGERISHSHPALTVAGASRVQHHCGTCGDRDATDFFCSALPAHIARPIPHRSSQFSRPAFFCRSFSRALLQANSCVLQLRVFCFPGSALTPCDLNHRLAISEASVGRSSACKSCKSELRHSAPSDVWTIGWPEEIRKQRVHHKH